MTPDSPPSRRPWYRFTIRRALLAVPVVALLVLLGAGINPLRRDPMQQALDEATEWCRTPTASFDASAAQFDVSTIVPTLTPGQPALASGRCVLKFVRAGDVIWDRRIVKAFGTSTALAPDGRVKRSQRTPSGQVDQQATLPADVLAAIEAILPTLPPSAPEIPPGTTIETHWHSATESQRMTESRAVVLGFQGGDGWETRVYDRKNLPPAVAQLLGRLGFDPYLP